MIKALIYSLNGRYYERAIQVFMLVVASHFLEHVCQIWQLYVISLPRPECLGLLGSFYPWLVTSEAFHYAHALFMLLGLAVFRISPLGGFWWELALWLAFYHHLEHAILLSQALTGENFCSMRCSLGSFLMPRIELHFVYNLMILIPMIVAFKRQKRDLNP